LLFKDYHDYEMRVLSNDSVILYHNHENINDQIINLLNQVFAFHFFQFFFWNCCCCCCFFRI